MTNIKEQFKFTAKKNVAVVQFAAAKAASKLRPPRLESLWKYKPTLKQMLSTAQDQSQTPPPRQPRESTNERKIARFSTTDGNALEQTTI